MLKGSTFKNLGAMPGANEQSSSRASFATLPLNVNWLFKRGSIAHILTTARNPRAIETRTSPLVDSIFGETDGCLVSDGELDDFHHNQQQRDDQVPAQGQHPYFSCHRPDWL